MTTKLIIPALVLGTSACSLNSQQMEGPNIIMILIDDQDMDETSIYGADVYTPNMDRIASEGIKFNQAFVSSTVSTPSRYSFLTGRYAGNSYSKLYKNEVGNDEQGFPGFNIALENDKMNVATVLNKAGYTTGFVGKYHLMSSYDQPEMYQGENTFIEGYTEGSAKDSKPSAAITEIFKHNEAWSREYLKYMGFDWAKNIYDGNLSKPYNSHNPEWTTSAVLEFLDENKDKPFFIQYCPTLLHGPDNEWVRSYDYPNYTGAGEQEAPPSVMIKRKELKEKLKKSGYNPKTGQWGIAWMDAAIGDILDKLDELGIADNTLVIFVPDHGSTTKASLFNINGTQVPLIMRWPKGIPAGTVCNALVQNIDLAPTYFELAGIKTPDNYNLDGRSLVPLLKTGETEEWRESLYFELGNARAVMTKDWKYVAVRYTNEDIEKIKNASYENLPKFMAPLKRLGIGIRGADHPGFWDEDQLYYLPEDSLEYNNLAYNPEYKKQLSQMKELLKDYIDEIGMPFGEFNNSGNATLPGQLDHERSIIKQLKIQGKTVMVPENLKK